MAARAVVYPDNLGALGVCRGLGVHGVPVTILSSDRSAPGQYSRYGRRVACPPKSDPLRFVDFLVDLARSERERPVLYLTDDAATVLVHRHRELLERWYRFTVSPWTVLETVLLKDRLYQALEGVVPVPHTRMPADEAGLAEAGEAVGYPAIVKPLLRCLTDGEDLGHPPFEKTFGSKAVRVHGLDELRATYRKARAAGFPVLVQEEIPGPISALRSVGLYATRRSEVAAAFTSEKLSQVPADFGDGLIVKAVSAPELIPLAARVVHHFGFYGMADIEFKWDPRAGVYKLLDINPRPWLWMNLPTACGVNLAHAAYLDAVGEPIRRADFVQLDFETRWVSLRGILVHLVRSLRAGRAREALVSCLANIRGRRVGPLFSPQDLLVRMFLSPLFWWESLRYVGHGLWSLRAVKEAR